MAVDGQAPRRTYAVGDVHGRLDLLRCAVSGIESHAGRTPYRIVMLGDYVDRGPDSRGVIEFLIDLQKRLPLVCLKGNHEDLMAKAITEPNREHHARWMSNGGEATLRSYGATQDADAADVVPREHLRWIMGLPRSTGDQHRIYVHAGVVPGVPVHRQKDDAFMWIRERFLGAEASELEAHVVHGHTPLWEGKRDAAEPELLAHRTNLDTAAFATGVLTIGVFEANAPGGPRSILAAKGAPLPHLVPAIYDDEARPERVSTTRESVGNWLLRRRSFKRS